MNFAVLQFPASNCDQDAVHVLRNVLGHSAELLWHKESSLGSADAVIVPGGFSYGDDIAAGRIFANQIAHHLRDQFYTFRDAGKPNLTASSPRGDFVREFVREFVSDGYLVQVDESQQRLKIHANDDRVWNRTALDPTLASLQRRGPFASHRTHISSSFSMLVILTVPCALMPACNYCVSAQFNEPTEERNIGDLSPITG